MTNELNKLRKEIESIDRKITLLFVDRMDVVTKISEIKKEMNLEISDPEREKYLIDTNSSYITDEVIRNYFKRLYNEILKISKEYQKDGK